MSEAGPEKETVTEKSDRFSVLLRRHEGWTLGVLLGLPDVLEPLADLVGVAPRQAQRHRGHDRIAQLRATVSETDLLPGQRAPAQTGGQHVHRLDYVADLAVPAAGVHADGPADRAGNPRQALQPRQT